MNPKRLLLALCVLFVCVPGFAVTRMWTGASSGKWSEPSNWSPAALPTSADTLVFPVGGSNRTMIDDLPAGTSVGAMGFNDSYDLSGNALTLMGDLSFGYNCKVTFHQPLTAGTTLFLGWGSQAIYAGGLDVNGQALTVGQAIFNGPLNGGGSIAVLETIGGFMSINGGGTFSGTIHGSFGINCSLPNATVTGGYLIAGVGTIGPLTTTFDSSMLSAHLEPGLAPLTLGTLRTGPLNLRGAFFVDLQPPTGSDQVKVTGSVTLSGSLRVNLLSGVPSPGQSFTIIDNDGTDPVNGTFSGLPEGATIAVSSWTFGVSYHGGDGNDVVLTRLASTSLGLAQDAATTRYGQPVTFTATMTSESGVPTGTVTFHTPAGNFTAPLQNGVATLTTSALTAGTPSVFATYDGVIPWKPATSGSVGHTVQPADTTTAVAVSAPSITYGDSSHFTATAAAVAPGAGVPTGNASLSVDGAVVRTAVLTNGTASFDLPLLTGGSHAITASYSGDSNFNSSASAPSSETVAKAPTTITAAAAPSPSYAGAIIAISTTVHGVTTPTGSVTVSSSGATLGTHALSGGSAVITAGPFSAGDQTIDVAYGGDANFLASSTVVHQTVLPPQITVSNMTTPGDTPHSLSIPLTLGAPMSVPVSVDFATADGTAVAGTAYVATHGTVTFAAGETVAAFTVDIIGNASAQPLAFTINFSNAINTTQPHSIMVTITSSGVATSYEFAPGLSLDLFGPSKPVAGGAPLILAIPGTTAYDSAAGTIAALRETARGYAVARVAYRGAFVAPFPAQLDDLTAAVAWIRANASMLNIDPNRIGAWGYGTGAHLAALLGTSNARLAAVVESSGATDLPDLNADALACSTVDHNAATSPESTLLGCAIPACTSLALDASPLHRVSSSSAATMIIHGEDDCVIGPQQAMRLFDALRHAGVYTLLRLIPGAGHEDTTGTAATMDAIDAFLDSHLKLGGARPRPARH